MAAEDDQRGNHRDVPHHRRQVRQEKAVITVQHAQTPRREDEQSGPRKQYADDRDGQIALVAGEPRRDHGAERRRREDADQHDQRDDEGQQGSDGAGHAVGVALLAAREERRVDRDERRGERPFAEQVLQEIGDPEAGGEGVGGVALETKVMREHSLPDKAREPADEDAGGDQHGRG